MKLVDLNKLHQGLTKFLSVSTPRKVILVRNCESQGNLAGTITGWMDVPLTDFGRKQAFKLSECLADLQVDTVSSSDL
jgi:broad specificity phosphatase PhoE